MLGVGLKGLIRLVIIASYLVLTPSIALSSDFDDRYSDIKFNSGEAHAIAFSDSTREYVANYSFYYQDRLYNEERLRYLIELTLNALFKYVSLNNINYSECIEHNNIEVYQVSISDLNDDRSRINIPVPVGRTVYGYFDPMLDDNSRSAIVITHSPGRIGWGMNQSIVAHEMAHYFYYRMCLWSFSTVKSEDFALNFESYFRDSF